MTSAAQAMQAIERLESEIASAPTLEAAAESARTPRSWIVGRTGVTVASIRVHPDRLPVDEDVVEGIVATIKAGNVNALPPIHVWRKQTGNVPILVAGRTVGCCPHRRHDLCGARAAAGAAGDRVRRRRVGRYLSGHGGRIPQGVW
jgi:hypothetical protein